jgi:HSP20 family protein
LSSDDKWFKRWGRANPFGPWSYADIEEMMKEMEKDFMDLDIEKALPRDLVRERREDDGSVTKEIGPIVYGYSVTVGPDGKPVVREFGNVKRGPTKEWKEAISGAREPLVEMVEGERDVRVIAELPGVGKQDIELTAEGDSLKISAETPTRKYRKVLELPSHVEPEVASSTFNNGILEVTLPKKRARRAGTRIKVD